MRLLKPENCENPRLCINHKMLLIAIGMDWSLYRARTGVDGCDKRLDKYYRQKTRESIAKYRSFVC